MPCNNCTLCRVVPSESSSGACFSFFVCSCILYCVHRCNGGRDTSSGEFACVLHACRCWRGHAVVHRGWH
jgi:hypothetical protein